MQTETEIENFFGVYLLCSKSENPRFRNRNYIGYTVNPNRRINQHNRGKNKGGAHRTDQKGPWIMIMIIHGFPNNISALRFEWAWQKPKESRRLKNLPEICRKRGESNFDHNFRILAEMLRIGPWNRLPLTIRWLADDFVREFPAGKTPPIHITICHGHVKIKKLKERENNCESLLLLSPIVNTCPLCYYPVSSESTLCCLNPKCTDTFHIICLANRFKSSGYYVPVEGDCPTCKKHMLWGDIIRKKNGCDDLEQVNTSDDESCESCDLAIEENDKIQQQYEIQNQSTLEEEVICLSDLEISSE